MLELQGERYASHINYYSKRDTILGRGFGIEVGGKGDWLKRRWLLGQLCHLLTLVAGTFVGHSPSIAFYGMVRCFESQNSNDLYKKKYNGLFPNQECLCATTVPLLECHNCSNAKNP